MKLYRVNNAGRLQSVDIPDGVLPIAVGCTLGPDGKDGCPIEAIDFDRRLYWRSAPSGMIGAIGAAHPFPERWIGEEDIAALGWREEP